MNYVPSRRVVDYLERARVVYGQRSLTATLNFLIAEHERLIGLREINVKFDKDGVLKH